MNAFISPAFPRLILPRYQELEAFQKRTNSITLRRPAPLQRYFWPRACRITMSARGPA
jgi:hypothetical protein